MSAAQRAAHPNPQSVGKGSGRLVEAQVCQAPARLRAQHFSRALLPCRAGLTAWLPRNHCGADRQLSPFLPLSTCTNSLTTRTSQQTMTQTCLSPVRRMTVVPYNTSLEFLQKVESQTRAAHSPEGPAVPQPTHTAEGPAVPRPTHTVTTGKTTSTQRPVPGSLPPQPLSQGLPTAPGIKLP